MPKKKGPNGYGLTLLLHSLGANYNQFSGSRNQSQFGDRGSGSIIITPSGRGPDGWYYDYAGADTFEVWADVAKRYPLDADYTSIAGYSMGGYGTYKFATQFPDLFAKAQPTVGPPGLGVAPADPAQPTGGASTSTFPMLASLRNIPFLIWDAVEDELVPFAGVQRQARRLRRPRLPLRVRRLRDRRAPDARRRRPVPAGRRLPRRRDGRPQPRARHLRAQPEDGLPRRRDDRRPRLLASATSS